MSQVLQQLPITASPADLLRLSDELTVRQKLFVYYYIETKNATKSAELAGYSGDRNTIASIGWENLQKPLIKAAIEEFYATRIASANHVLAEASDIAVAPWREFVEVKIDPLTGATISAQVKLSDKLKAIELVGKYHKLFTDRVETDGPSEQVSGQLVELLKVLCERARVQMDQAQQLAGEANVIDVSPLAAITTTDDDHC